MPKGTHGKRKYHWRLVDFNAHKQRLISLFDDCSGSGKSLQQICYEHRMNFTRIRRSGLEPHHFFPNKDSKKNLDHLAKALYEQLTEAGGLEILEDHWMDRYTIDEISDHGFFNGYLTPKGMAISLLGCSSYMLPHELAMHLSRDQMFAVYYGLGLEIGLDAERKLHFVPGLGPKADAKDIINHLIMRARKEKGLFEDPEEHNPHLLGSTTDPFLTKNIYGTLAYPRRSLGVYLHELIMQAGRPITLFSYLKTNEKVDLPADDSPGTENHNGIVLEYPLYLWVPVRGIGSWDVLSEVKLSSHVVETYRVVKGDNNDGSRLVEPVYKSLTIADKIFIEPGYKPHRRRIAVLEVKTGGKPVKGRPKPEILDLQEQRARHQLNNTYIFFVANWPELLGSNILLYAMRPICTDGHYGLVTNMEPYAPPDVAYNQLARTQTLRALIISKSSATSALSHQGSLGIASRHGTSYAASSQGQGIVSSLRG